MFGLAFVIPFLAPPSTPLMRDFMGLNTHTVQFKPDLFRPVTQLIRNYHPIDWDLEHDPSRPLTLPKAANGVDWNTLYPVWRDAGFRTSATVMFETIEETKWANIGVDGFRYGAAFGEAFGKSSAVEAIEIGNEPGKFSDGGYRQMFEAMARGVRSTAPNMLISTCAVFDEPSGDYHKNIETVKGLADLFDVISVHVYAQIEPWPTFRRSNPENPKAPFLEPVRKVMQWRDRHAPGKQIWVTEFGWDASTKKADSNSDNPQWVGNTELEQAQWLVRGYLELAALGVDRAYIFWFNDEDNPSIHASSGLTRHYQPKPSYWAVKHLYDTLGDQRYIRTIPGPNEVRIMEFQADSGKTTWVVWVATEAGEARYVDLPLEGRKVESMKQMPTTNHPALSVPHRNGTVMVNGSPLYITFASN